MRPFVGHFFVGLQKKPTLFLRPCIGHRIRDEAFDHRPAAISHSGINEFSAFQCRFGVHQPQTHLVEPLWSDQTDLGGDKGFLVSLFVRDGHRFATQCSGHPVQQTFVQ